MAMTPDEIDALPEYTDAQLLKLYRLALVDLVRGGKSVSINGRSLTRADEKFVKDMISWLESRIAGTNDEDLGDVTLAVFGGPFGR